MTTPAPNLPSSPGTFTASTPPGPNNVTGGGITDLAGTMLQRLVNSELTVRKEEAAWTIANAARMTRQAGGRFREHGQAPLAQYADRAAEQMESASSYLHQHDLPGIVHDVESLARRQPALFIGGGLL